MTRLELATRVAESVRAALPDRAGAILAAFEARLEAGPWSALLAPKRPPDPLMPRDSMIRELKRALEHDGREDADAALLAVERWLLDAVAALLEEQLGNDTAHESAASLIAWAGDALEAGADSPSLRILAGLSKVDREEAWGTMRRAARELGFPVPTDERCERRRGRRIAADFFCGRMTLSEAAQRMRQLQRWGAGLYTVWDRLADDVELAESGHASPQQVAADVREQLAQLFSDESP